MAIDLASELQCALEAFGASSCSDYLAVVGSAATAAPAPYLTNDYVNEYRRRACEPSWMCACLLANAVKEADGATQLAQFAGRIPEHLAHVRNSVVSHANDEAKHARVFLRLLSLAFPDAELSEDLAAQLEVHLPAPSLVAHLSDRAPYTDQQVLDELCQINIGEVRTRINQLIIEPVLVAHAPDGAKERIQSIIRKLLADEQQHIAYTALHLDALSSTGMNDALRSIYAHRFARFNHRTLCELRGETVDL